MGTEIHTWHADHGNHDTPITSERTRLSRAGMPGMRSEPRTPAAVDIVLLMFILETGLRIRT